MYVAAWTALSTRRCVLRIAAQHGSSSRAALELVERAQRLALALDHAVQRVDGFAARDLAGVVPAHAVGDDVQPELVVDEERVLVGQPPPTDVTHAECGVLHAGLSSGGAAAWTPRRPLRPPL